MLLHPLARFLRHVAGDAVDDVDDRAEEAEEDEQDEEGEEGVGHFSVCVSCGGREVVGNGGQGG